MNKNSVRLEKFSSKIKSLKCYWIAILIASIWISIILYYTGGGLLVGGDVPGYYNAFSALSTGIPNAIIYGTGLLLANGNIYLGFYAGTLIGICLNVSAFTYFLTTLFEEWKGKILPVTIANILFVFSMFTVYNTFKSVIATAAISGCGLFLFLALAVKLYRHMINSGRFTKLDCILMGIGIAVSSGVPPTPFRMILLEGAIMVGLLFLAIIKESSMKISNMKNVLKSFFFTLPLIVVIAIAGMGYWEWRFFSSLKTNVNTFTQAARSLGLSTLNAPYATLVNTFRILGVWAFQTGYCPYHYLFYSNAVVTIASFLWPIAALGLSVLLVKGSSRLKILLLVAVSLLIIGWDTANNPPIGAINLFAVSHVPLLSSLFPTFFVSDTLLPIFYTVLSTFVVVRLIELLHSSKRQVLHFRYKKLVLVVPLLLVVLLVVPDAPFFTGSAIGQYFNPNVKGIWVPNDYFTVRSILSSTMQSGCTALFWPSMTTYIQTSWGYQGTNSFYNNFFAPLSVITPDSFGGYSLLNPNIATSYSLLTSAPITESDNSTNITSYANFGNFYVQGAKFTNFDNVISLYSVNESSPYVYIGVPFYRVFNASDYYLFTVQFSAGSQSLIETLLKTYGLWIGIGSSDNFIGWYLPGSTASSNYTLNGDTITVSMIIGSPNKPWAASVYNSASIDKLVFSIPTQDLTSNSYFSLSLSSISIKAFLGAVAPSVISLWRQYDVEYLVLDNSNVGGVIIAPQQYVLPVTLLVNSGVLSPVFVGEYLQLYKVNYAATS